MEGQRLLSQPFSLEQTYWIVSTATCEQKVKPRNFTQSGFLVGGSNSVTLWLQDVSTFQMRIRWLSAFGLPEASAWWFKWSRNLFQNYLNFSRLEQWRNKFCDSLFINKQYSLPSESESMDLRVLCEKLIQTVSSIPVWPYLSKYVSRYTSLCSHLFDPLFPYYEPGAYSLFPVNF